jgi:hypothetical protein
MTSKINAWSKEVTAKGGSTDQVRPSSACARLLTKYGSQLFGPTPLTIAVLMQPGWHSLDCSSMYAYTYALHAVHQTPVHPASHTPC